MWVVKAFLYNRRVSGITLSGDSAGAILFDIDVGRNTDLLSFTVEV
jgi:hypothetical protein